MPAGGYPLGRLADDVSAVIENLGIDRAVLIGHSMGGMVAQEFCKNFSRSVSGLVLVTPIAADLQNRLISKRIEKDNMSLGFRVAFLNHFNGWFAVQTDPAIVDWVREEMLKTPENVGLKLMRAYSRFDLREHLPDFRMPCLVIGARDDTSAVPAEPQTLAGLIPGSGLVMIDACGHFSMLEKPEEFENLLDEFFSQNRL